MNDKEKSVTDIIAERAAKINESKAVMNKAQKEERKLTKEEIAILDANELAVRSLTLSKLEKELENRTATAPKLPKKNVSLRSMILEAADGGHFSEENLEVMKRGRKLLAESGVGSVATNQRGAQIDLPLETRAAQTVGVAANGGNTVEDDRQGILLPLMDSLVLDSLGVTRASGLTGNVVFPSATAITASWVGETTNSTETNTVFANDVTFKPKRLTAMVTISRQLLMQSSEDVEMILRRLITEATQDKLQSTIFGADAATSTKPGGLFSDLPTDSGDISFERIIAMRTALATNNALRGNPKFLLNPLLDGKCRTTLKSSVAGAEYLLSDMNKMAGFDVIETNSVPTGLQTGADESGIAFGNWADYFIGSWGAISLTVDPYTKAGQDSIVLYINSYWDAGKLREESIVTATAK